MRGEENIEWRVNLHVFPEKRGKLFIFSKKQKTLFPSPSPPLTLLSSLYEEAQFIQFISFLLSAKTQQFLICFDSHLMKENGVGLSRKAKTVLENNGFRK